MLINSKDNLLRTSLAYEVLMAKLQEELDSCFEAPSSVNKRINYINIELNECQLMLDAINFEIRNSF